MDSDRQQGGEPGGLSGSRIVLVFFLLLGFITIASYFVFRYLLDIPAA